MFIVHDRRFIVASYLDAIAAAVFCQFSAAAVLQVRMGAL
jgi:hypothetical protein